MTLQVLSENAQHGTEEHVVALNGVPLVDAQEMDAEQSPVQVEDRKASQVEMMEKLEHQQHGRSNNDPEKLRLSNDIFKFLFIYFISN